MTAQTSKILGGPTKQYNQGMLAEREGKMQCNGLQSVLKLAATG